MSNNITNPNLNYYSGPYYNRLHLLPVTYTLNFKDINNNVVYAYRLNPNNHGYYNGDNFKLNESIAFPISKSIFNKIKTVELNIDPYKFCGHGGSQHQANLISFPIINFSINFLSATDLGSGVQYNYITNNNNITSTGTEYIKPQCAMYTNDNIPVNTENYFDSDPFFSVPFAKHNYQYNTINNWTNLTDGHNDYAIYNPGDQTLSMLSCEYITLGESESSHTNITVKRNSHGYYTDNNIATYGLENNYSIGIENFCKHGQIYFPIYLMNNVKSIDAFDPLIYNNYSSSDLGGFNAIKGHNIFISFNNVPTEVPKLSNVHTSDNKACNILLDHPNVHTSVFAVEYMFIQMMYSSDTNLSVIDFKTNKQNSVDHFSSDTLNISLNQGHYIVVFNFQYPEFTGNEAFKISFKSQNNEIVIYETPEVCVNNLEGSVLGNSFMNIKEIPTGFTGVITYTDTSLDNSSTRDKFIDILLIAC